MRKLLLILSLLVLIVGYTLIYDKTVDSIDVNVLLNITGTVPVEGSPDVYQFTVVDQQSLIGSFDITEIEILTTGFAEFPYESEFIERQWDEYSVILQDLFDEISENDSLGGSNSIIIGPKAKLIISIKNDTDTIICEFYQDENEELVNLRIKYIDADGDTEHKYYTDGYTEIFDSLNNLLND